MKYKKSKLPYLLIIALLLMIATADSMMNGDQPEESITINVGTVENQSMSPPEYLQLANLTFKYTEQ